MLASLAVVALLPAPMPVSLAHDVGERQLKAEMIVRMLRLVTWPPPTVVALPIRLTVVGDPALADALRDASAGQRIDGRSLVVSHAVAVTQLADPPPAVVVLAAPQRASAPALAKVLDHKGVLTIGEGEGMGTAGLVLGVYVDGDRIRFDANTGAASRAGLSLSSHLLRLARIVG